MFAARAGGRTATQVARHLDCNWSDGSRRLREEHVVDVLRWAGRRAWLQAGFVGPQEGGDDEHDKEEDNIIDYGDGRYLLQANTPLVEFNEFFESNITSDNYDTVAGLVISGFSYLPEQMSEISLHGFQFKVLKTDTRRLHLLEVQRKIIDIKSSKNKD